MNFRTNSMKSSPIGVISLVYANACIVGLVQTNSWDYFSNSSKLNEKFRRIDEDVIKLNLSLVFF